MADLKAHVDDEIATRDAACTGKLDPSSEWLKYEVEQYAQEQTRGEHSRAFHQAMFAVGGIAIAAMLGLFAWFETSKLTGFTTTSTVVLRLEGLYIVLQLISILRGATRGIGVRPYETPPHPVILANEAPEAYDRRKAAATRRATAFNTEQNNDRISWKILVVRSWKNFGAGLIVMVISAVITLIYNAR